MARKGQKLVYLSDAAIPSREANSIQIMKMCEAFAQQGLDVTLLVPNRPTNESSDPYEFYGVETCFDIKKLPWKPGERYLYSLVVPYHVRKIDPDMVYGRFIPACFFTSLLGYQIVYEAHEPVDKTDKIISKMFNIMLRLKKLGHIVVISNALKQHYLSKYSQITEQDIIVAHDAAVIPKNTSRVSLGESDRLQIGYVGHLYEGKGMSLIAELVNECTWADFHIVGGTEQDIQLWSEKWSEYKNVHFHGFVPHQEVFSYIKSMDILLAPYQKEVYGTRGKTDLSQWMSPLKIFEYMAAGKPIICSDLDVLNEVLTDEKNALLCPRDKRHSWVSAIERLQMNEDFKTKLENNAKCTFSKNHTYNSRSFKILNQIADHNGTN